MEGNITATVYSLVSSGDNSTEIVVTVETNSREPPDTLTDLLTQPLEQRLQEFTTIDQQFMFRIIGTKRHGMLHFGYRNKGSAALATWWTFSVNQAILTSQTLL